MLRLSDFKFAVCALLLCVGMQFSTSASADCHDLQPSATQTIASAHHTTVMANNDGLVHALGATAAREESEIQQPKGHDCCDGDMRQCPMAQCAGVFYASTSTPSSSSAPRPTMHFHPVRVGAPNHPSSTLFRPPILS
jgi:hypothetical protein